MKLGGLAARWLVSLVLAGCWVASLFTPAVVIDYGHQVYQGYAILIGGLAGPIMFQFAWFANPLLLAVLLRAAIGRERRAKRDVIATLLLASLAINALFWKMIPWEGDIERFEIGYYLWLVAMFGGAIWGLIAARLVAPAEED